MEQIGAETDRSHNPTIDRANQADSLAHQPYSSYGLRPRPNCSPTGKCDIPGENFAVVSPGCDTLAKNETKAIPERFLSEMTSTKEYRVPVDRYGPARELAARATSKHGNPADHAIVVSTDVPGAAGVIAARVYAEANELDGRSHRGDIALCFGPQARPRIAVVIDVARDAEAILDRGGFSLAWAPRSARDCCPRFEGRVRVDQVNAANCRVVAQGRYIDFEAPDGSAIEEYARTAAEDALREIVGLITASNN
jgi:hypothetical protein